MVSIVGHVALIALALLVPGTAHACSLIPPPDRVAGETDAAYSGRITAFYRDLYDGAERNDWDRADSVFTARVVGLVPNTLYGEPSTKAVLQPVRRLKGTLPRGKFVVRPVGASMCGGNGADLVAAGKPGDLFVIYLAPGKPSEKTWIGGNSPANIHDSRVLALLAAQD